MITETPAEINAAVESAFSRLDKDHDGSISLEEFSAATGPLSKGTLRAAFDLFDTVQSQAIERCFYLLGLF